MSVDQIIKDIKSIKIQGAENVAKASVLAIKEALHTSKNHNKPLLDELIHVRKQLETARSTEPCLRNTLTLLFNGVNDLNVRPKVEQNIIVAEKHFQSVSHLIAEFGSRKIKEGMIVFTHCHSGTVTGIMKEAKKKKVKFSVKNTETRPLFQGRITAKELADAGIPVEHFIDSAGRLAVKSSDMMFIGADAITTEGIVINKIGSELLAETASRKGIPVYVCTDSWKFDVATVYGFDEKIEKRHEEEVWKDKPKGVNISNYAFEQISPDLITGIISEIGIYSPKVFIEEVERHYPWLFQKLK